MKSYRSTVIVLHFSVCKKDLVLKNGEIPMCHSSTGPRAGKWYDALWTELDWRHTIVSLENEWIINWETWPWLPPIKISNLNHSYWDLGDMADYWPPQTGKTRLHLRNTLVTVGASIDRKTSMVHGNLSNSRRAPKILSFKIGDCELWILKKCRSSSS